MVWTSTDRDHMQRAMELAERGRGHVEPNPMVGCVIAAGEAIVAEGWHQRFGGPHAEIEALKCAGESARGATMYVTLEPCCHYGKTPPCCTSIITAGIRRVVLALEDPFPQVAGGGVRQLQQAGVDVDIGLMMEDARYLNAPYWKLVTRGHPWVIGKWAMSLDGKTATWSGDSRWISNETSRAFVHRLRGQVDAILVGRRTAELDDPRLTARPAGPRLATRIVLDSNASLSSTSQLVRTAREAPVLVVTGPGVAEENRMRLIVAGCEILTLEGRSWNERIPGLLEELGRRRMTNLLVEGGGAALSGFWETGCLDEVHVFVSPILLGGVGAASSLAGHGVAVMPDAWRLDQPRFESLDGDIHIWGRVMPSGADQMRRFPHPPASQ